MMVRKGQRNDTFGHNDKVKDINETIIELNKIKKQDVNQISTEDLFIPRNLLMISTMDDVLLQGREYILRIFYRRYTLRTSKFDPFL